MLDVRHARGEQKSLALPILLHCRRREGLHRKIQTPRFYERGPAGATVHSLHRLVYANGN